MGVAALVDQHAVDRGAQVGAMVQVKAAQVKLVRLALTAVLTHHQTGHRFQQLAGPVDSARVQLTLRHNAFVGRARIAQQAVARALYLHRGQGCHGGGIGRLRPRGAVKQAPASDEGCPSGSDPVLLEKAAIYGGWTVHS